MSGTNPNPSALDETIARLNRLIHQHRDPCQPRSTARMEHDLKELVSLRALTMPPPSLRVEQSEFLAPDEAFRMQDRMVFGRFAWFYLMRMVRAPWPEAALEPDLDFPRDAPPMEGPA